jgi:hypothetical protein
VFYEESSVGIVMDRRLLIEHVRFTDAAEKLPNYDGAV